MDRVPAERPFLEVASAAFYLGRVGSVTCPIQAEMLPYLSMIAASIIEGLNGSQAR